MNKTQKLITVLAIVVTQFAFATIYYVDADTSGANWYSETNFSFVLTTALGSAATGDTIFVAKGSYYPTSGTDTAATFTLVAGVKMYGGFTGGESSIDQRTPKINETILSGDIGTADVNSDNCIHVVTANAAMTSSTVVDGFVITDGNARGITGNGGGMVFSGTASPLITNCIFKDNEAINGGACNIADVSTNPTFEYCLFSNNSATTRGGVFEIGGVTLTLTINKSTIVSNTAPTESVVFVSNKATVNIDSCIFWYNNNGSGTLNAITKHQRGTLSITSTASDEALTGATQYTTTDDDGPFLDLIYYYQDGNHSINSGYGWIGSKLILDLKTFLEGSL